MNECTNFLSFSTLPNKQGAHYNPIRRICATVTLTPAWFFHNNPPVSGLGPSDFLGVSMSTEQRMSKKKKIRVSAIACACSTVIALLLDGTMMDKLVWSIEFSVFSLVVIWTIW